MTCEDMGWWIDSRLESRSIDGSTATKREISLHVKAEEYGKRRKLTLRGFGRVTSDRPTIGRDVYVVGKSRSCRPKPREVYVG